MKIASLKSSWYSLLQKSQMNSQLGEVIFADLVNAYSHPTRHYHNLEHIQHLLNLSEQVREISDNFAVLQFSA